MTSKWTNILYMRIFRKFTQLNWRKYEYYIVILCVRGFYLKSRLFCLLVREKFSTFPQRQKLRCLLEMESLSHFIFLIESAVKACEYGTVLRSMLFGQARRNPRYGQYIYGKLFSATSARPIWDGNWKNLRMQLDAIQIWAESDKHFSTNETSAR